MAMVEPSPMLAHWEVSDFQCMTDHVVYENQLSGVFMIPRA